MKKEILKSKKQGMTNLLEWLLWIIFTLIALFALGYLAAILLKN